MKTDLNFLKSLCEAFAPPSMEGEVRALLSDRLLAAGLHPATSRNGNLTVTIKGKSAAPHVAFLAHMDEPGLMLTEAQDEYFRFEPLGRIDPRVLSGRFVVLGDEQTRRKGLIAAKGIHLQDRAERRKIPKSDDLYIDIGAKDADDAAKMLSVGDLGVFDTPFAVFGEADGYFRGKALSGRVACAVLAELASALAKEAPACTVSILFLARCEAVPAAAGTALAECTPDIAVLTDGVPADDMSDKPRGVTLGGGAVLPFADSRALYDRALHAIARETAEKAGISYTVPASMGAGSDFSGLNFAGVRSLLVGYPVRTGKAPTSVVAKNDVTALENLLSALLPRLAKGEE